MRHRRNTKVSITRLSKEFVRRKTNLARIELYQDAEYVDHTSDRPSVEDVDWADFKEIAWILGDPSDMHLAAMQPTIRFILSILLAGIAVGHSPAGFAQAIEIFRFLDNIRMRQLDAGSA